jgi:hypothetical protein
MGVDHPGKTICPDRSTISSAVAGSWSVGPTCSMNPSIYKKTTIRNFPAGGRPWLPKLEHFFISRVVIKLNPFVKYKNQAWNLSDNSHASV